MSSVVFEVFGENGTMEFDSDETIPRLIHSESFAYDFTGTFSVPTFDDTKGTFMIALKVCKYKKDYPNPRVADDYILSDSSWGVSPGAIPSLYWNNTTKVMTVTAAPHPTARIEPGDVTLNFIHYQ